MAVAGSLTYSTEIDKNGFEKGLKDLENNTQSAGTKIKNIVMALGIDKIISATINTIKSSISSAMDRIDTMNQFTRVMTVMTGSAEKADEALDSIKKTVTGTAYGLDVASRSTQKLVTGGMELKKSTKQIQTWADAVAFYGDGTNATFENVTDALSKMVAKGKVEMDQLNRLTDSGIPAVQIYADMVGKSVSEVQDDLSKGKISTEQFLDGLDKAFNDGTNKFASITGAAQEAGASWTATFDNFKAAITRGMTNIINAIDEGLKSIGLKTIREIISDIGKQTEKTMNRITPLIKKGIKILKDVYDWVSKNKDIIKKLVIVIASVTAGYIAYQKVLVAIQAIKTAKNILGTVSAFLSLIPTIKSAKDAMLLLNMTFSVNPIGLVVAGIVALTAAFVGLQVAEFKERASLKGLKDEVESQKKAWEDLQEARKNSLDSSMTEIGICEDLKNELMQITDENGKVKEGYEGRAKVILNTLNGALGTEYELNGNIIKQYKELKENIDKVIATKKAEAVLNAYQEEYEMAIKEQSKAVKTLTELKQQQIDASEKFIKGNYQERLEAQQTLSQIASKMREQTDLIGSYGKTIQDYENLQKAHAEGSKEAITKAIDDIGISYNTLKETAGKSTIEQINAQQKYVDAIKSSLEEARAQHNEYQQQILENQLAKNEEQLTNLKNSLVQQTNTIKELTPEQIEAWKETANRSVVEYSQLLAQVPEETQKEIEKATGIVGQDVGLYKAMRK